VRTLRSSRFPHANDEGFQLIVTRLWSVEPCERFSIPFDCARGDAADELTFFDELRKLLCHVAFKAGVLWRGQIRK